MPHDLHTFLQTFQAVLLPCKIRYSHNGADEQSSLPGIWRRVDRNQVTDVQEESSASIFRFVEVQVEKASSLKRRYINPNLMASYPRRHESWGTIHY